MSDNPTVTPANLPIVAPDFTPATMGKLANEIATDLREVADVLKDYNLSQEQYEKLLANATFKQMLDAATRQWKSANGVNERLRLEAAASLERILPTLTARLGDKNEPLPAVVEGSKFLAKTAGLDTSIVPNGPGAEKFSIQINIGDRKLEYENKVRPITIEQSGAGPSVPLIPQGPGEDAPV